METKTHSPKGRVLPTLYGVVLALVLAALACTSNDTLFIKLTATPIPTIPPTALSGDIRYKKGDKLYAVEAQRVINLSGQPTAKIDIEGGMLTCFRNTQVTVLDTSRSVTDPKDTTIFYKIDCGGGGEGWLPEYKLTLLNPGGGTAIVKSPDGKGAPIYSQSTVKSDLASPKPCPDGTKVEISDITRNFDLSATSEDTELYVSVTCGDASGYIVASMLVPVS